MTAHKSFAEGEILTAADVNEVLNPTTAGHIPWAVAAGAASLTIPAAGGSASTAIVFPPGRFAVAPVVTLTPDTSSALHVESVTAGGCVIVATQRPRGRVAAISSSSNTASITTTETAYLTLSATLQPNRLYQIALSDHWADSDTTGTALDELLRIALDGATVTTASTLIRRNRIRPASAAGAWPGMTAMYPTTGWAAARPVQVLMSFVRGSVASSGTVRIASQPEYPAELSITDLGSSVDLPTTVQWHAHQMVPTAAAG